MTIQAEQSGAGQVLGIGVDLVEIGRLRRAIRRWAGRFTARVFLAGEQADCESKTRPWVHYAGRFAVKEAVAKALGTGIGIGSGLGWLDIEVVTDHDAKAPSVRFSPAGQRMIRARGVGQVLVSLSHTREYAVAQAVLIGLP